MKLTVYLFGLAGAALFAWLLMRQGIHEVGSLVASAGWGLLLVAVFHLVPLWADTVSWWRLFPPGRRPTVGRLLWMRWVGEGVNNLLPTAQVGGDIVRARLATLNGVGLPLAAATVVVDLTSNLFTQAIFTLLGLGLLVGRVGGTSLTSPILIGVGVAVLLVLGFYAVQQIGFFHLLERFLALFGHGLTGLVRNGRSLDEAVQAIYRRRRDFAMSCAWTLISWTVGAGEVWIALRLLGAPVSLAEALILESMGLAVRSALFVVPGALGVQEAATIGVGILLGLPPGTSLALALVKRVRELALGLPGLAVWQWLEGRRLLQQRQVGRSGEEAVDVVCGPAAFPDGVDHQGLTAPHVAGGKDAEDG